MDKIWLNSYESDVVKEINPDQYQSVVECLEKNFKDYYQRPALEQFSQILTYQQWWNLSQDFASYLQQNPIFSFKKGERFALCLPNCLQYPVALLGAWQAGLTAVNINPLSQPRELIDELLDAGASGIIIYSIFIDNLALALQESSQLKSQLKQIIITQPFDLCNIFYRWGFSIYRQFSKKYNKNINNDINNLINFNKTLKQGRNLKHSFNLVNLTGNDVALLQYTGGSTGVLKAAVLTHHNLVANILQMRAWVGHHVNLDQEIVLTPLPLYHIFSLSASLLLFSTLGARSVLILDPRKLTQLIAIWRKVNPTVLFGLNTLFQKLLENKDFIKINFKSLKFTISGGMAMVESVAKTWETVTQTTLLQGYGLTECSPVVSMSPLSLKHYQNNIGLALPNTEIKIMAVNSDNSDNKELSINQIGELWVRGPQVMAGYWNNLTETQQILTPDGWLKTGDLAQIDEQGFITLMGRKKLMILVSGFNVYPQEIETVLLHHPDIGEVAVIGVPNKQHGEIVKACIVRKNINLTELMVKNYCQKFLTPYKRPRIVEFFDTLPKNKLGKILYHELS